MIHVWFIFNRLQRLSYLQSAEKSRKASTDIPNSRDMYPPSTFRDTPTYPPSTSRDTPTYPPSTSRDTPTYPPSTSRDTPTYPPSTSRDTPTYPPSTSRDTPTYPPPTSGDTPNVWEGERPSTPDFRSSLKERRQASSLSLSHAPKRTRTGYQ